MVIAPGLIKDIDAKEHTVVGYPSTFGHIDSMHEAVDAGAFALTIERWGPTGKNRIKALYQHDPAWLVGRPVDMVEDELGLRVTTKMADTSMARDVFKLIEDGVITEQSIGYDVIKDHTDEDNVRHLTEVKLYEYSFVTWGANEYTPITSAKSRTEVLYERMERMSRALKAGRFESDDVPIMMELAIKQWQEMLPPKTKEGPPEGKQEEAEAELEPTKVLGEITDWVRKSRLERDLKNISREVKTW